MCMGVLMVLLVLTHLGVMGVNFELLDDNSVDQVARTVAEHETQFNPPELSEKMNTDIPGESLNPNEYDATKNTVFDAVNFNEESDPIELANAFEGDIIISSADLLTLRQVGSNRNAIIDMEKKWPNGVIPYVISNAYDKDERLIIAKAMSEYHAHTCIRFVPRSVEKDYIHILKADGCSSSVGRSGTGPQSVSLGLGCVNVGTVIHELMHAAGFWHEQSRGDRDKYITINKANIITGMEYNFDKFTWDVIQNLGSGYDYGSVMHYNAYAFSANRQPTIVPIQPGATIGQRSGFSEIDKQKLNKLYNCGTSEIVTTTSPITPSPSGCVDTSHNCAAWAGMGECDKNPAWMNVNCAKSCNKCGEDCKDQNENCDYWKGKNECVTNSAYMTLFCKKSCGACHVSGDMSSSCEDKNEHCAAWADKGNCRINPDYMLIYCKKSCKQC